MRKHGPEGPQQRPPAHLKEGAIGWRFLKRHASRNRWEPTGFEVIYPDRVLEVSLAGNIVAEKTLYEFD